jgi:cyclic dehypoxanthinyl futalosine synthase
VHLAHLYYGFLKWDFQAGLRFGGNDVGSVMLEENVVRAAGVTNCTTEEELRRIIRDAGFRPPQRDTLYRQYFLN